MIPADDLAGKRTQTVVDTAAQQVTVVVRGHAARPTEVDGAEVIEARWFAEADLPTGARARDATSRSRRSARSGRDAER